MSAILQITVLVCTFQIICVETFNLSITPDHIRTSMGSETISIKCVADVALTGCQFRWVNGHDGRTSDVGPLLDMRLGRYSTADPAHLDDSLLGYSYSGQGLGTGECGLTMQITGFKIHLVSCRVKAGAGGWKYAWIDIYAEPYKLIPNKMVTPRELVALPGKNAALMMKSEESFNRCLCTPPGQSQLVFDKGAASPDSKGRYTYHGAGLERGECGINIANLTETDNGYGLCYIGKESKRLYDRKFTAVVVAAPPSAPVLRVSYNGREVTAYCEVGESRPVANITWFLADEIIRQDSTDDTHGTSADAWRWPWTRGSIRQNLTLSLRPEDGGKLLECVVSHAALSGLLHASESLRFEGISMAEAEKTRAAMAVETESLALEAAKFKARAQEAMAEAEKTRAAMAVETESLALEAAKSKARAEEARARAEEAKALGEEYWATNLMEELKHERQWRNQSLQAMLSKRSDQS